MSFDFAGWIKVIPTVAAPFYHSAKRLIDANHLPEDTAILSEYVKSTLRKLIQSGERGKLDELLNTISSQLLPGKDFFEILAVREWLQDPAVQNDYCQALREVLLEGKEDVEEVVSRLASSFSKYTGEHETIGKKSSNFILAILTSITLSDFAKDNSTQAVAMLIQEGFRSLGETIKSMSKPAAPPVKYDQNILLAELNVAGYTSENGKTIPLYFDKHDLYVHRMNQERALFSEIRSYDGTVGKWISVVGDAGHGKSSLLWHVFQHCKEHNGSYTAHLVPVQLLGARGLADVIDDIGVEGRHGAILMIDTVDLLVDAKDASTLTQMLSGCLSKNWLVISTSRREEASRIVIRDKTCVEIGKYENDEARNAVKRYVNAYYKNEDEKYRARQEEDIWNLLDSQRKIQELDFNPLILSMIFQSYAPFDIPRDINSQKVYQHYWDTKVVGDRTATSPKHRLLRPLLCQDIAYSITFGDEEDATDTIDVLEIPSINTKISEEDVYPILEQLKSTGVFHDACGGARVRFFHQTFLEYASAMYIRKQLEARSRDTISIMLSSIRDNEYKYLPILKQVIIQDYNEGSGSLCKILFENLLGIRSIVALQIVLEAFGKIDCTDDILNDCIKSISQDPDHFATITIEVAQYYPKNKIRQALLLLENCIGTTEEIAIYSLCKDKYLLLDPSAVFRFLYNQKDRIKSLRNDDNKKIYYFQSLFPCLKCDPAALSLLFELYFRAPLSQKAATWTEIGKSIADLDKSVVADFIMHNLSKILEDDLPEITNEFFTICMTIIPANEVLHSFFQDLVKNAFWLHNKSAAIGLGLFSAKSLDATSVANTISLLFSDNFLDRMYAEVSLESSQVEGITELVIAACRECESNVVRQLLHKIGSKKAETVSQLMILNDMYGWTDGYNSIDPLKAFYQRFSDLDSNLARSTILNKLKSSTQEKEKSFIFRVLVHLILEGKISLSAEDVKFISTYPSSVQDLETFSGIAGLIFKYDKEFALDFFERVLNSGYHNVKTKAITSLKLALPDHLDMVLAIGNLVVEKSSNKDRYGTLHCYLMVVKANGGSGSADVLERLNLWLNDSYAARLADSKAISEFLTLLKIHHNENPFMTYSIASRLKVTDKGNKGALLALYANIIDSIDNEKVLESLLNGVILLSMERQTRTKHAIRKILPSLGKKLGTDKVFSRISETYKDFTDFDALDHFMRAAVLMPGWSPQYSERLTKDPNCPAGIVSLLLSKA